MTPADLSRIESLAREATPGEWEAWDEPSEGPPTVARCNENGCREIAYITEHPHLPDPRKEASANAAYIAAANPAAVLTLIERVTAQDELLAQCKATLEALHPSTDLPDSDVARLYNAMMEKLDG